MRAYSSGHIPELNVTLRHCALSSSSRRLRRPCVGSARRLGSASRVGRARWREVVDLGRVGGVGVGGLEGGFYWAMQNHRCGGVLVSRVARAAACLAAGGAHRASAGVRVRGRVRCGRRGCGRRRRARRVASRASRSGRRGLTRAGGCGGVGPSSLRFGGSVFVRR